MLILVGKHLPVLVLQADVPEQLHDSVVFCPIQGHAMSWITLCISAVGVAKRRCIAKFCKRNNGSHCTACLQAHEAAEEQEEGDETKRLLRLELWEHWLGAVVSIRMLAG